MEKELLSKMYSATLKCLTIADKIDCVEDIKKTLVYENLISNLILIKDIESKIKEETKKELDTINWDKFHIYDKAIISDLHETDVDMIYKILKEELPELQKQLENVIFK